jgi:hypothetical protein
MRGAGSIGATLLSPVDAAARALNGGRPVNVGGYDIVGQDRRAGMDNALQTMGAQPDSLMFNGGKLAGEIAGTAGAGGAIAKFIGMAAPSIAARIPNLLEAVGSSGMQGGNLLTRSAGGAVSGAAQAGLVDPNEAAMGAGIGGAAPGILKGAGALGQAVGHAIVPKVAPEVAALADRAKQLGIDIPVDRLTNSKPLNAVAASLNYVPLSGRAGTEAKMGEQLNTALSRTFGQNSSNVTQALRNASADLGGKFDQVLQANTVKITPTFKAALADAENQATNELGAESAGIIHKQIADILTKGANGEIDGQAAYNIKKTLDRIGSRNTPEAFYARDLKKSLMNALNDSLGTQQAAEFGALRKQYGNMLDLENLAQNGAEGGVSIARLANLKNIGNKDLQELADISAQFLKSRESPHGALQRLVIGGSAAGAGGMAGLPVLAGTMAAARGTNALLNSSTARKLALGQTPNGLAALANPAVAQFGYRAAPVLAADR